MMTPVSVRLFFQQLTCNAMFFSFRKAFVKCPSLSVNGIFDDVTITSSLRKLMITLGIDFLFS